VLHVHVWVHVLHCFVVSYPREDVVPMRIPEGEDNDRDCDDNNAVGFVRLFPSRERPDNTADRDEKKKRDELVDVRGERGSDAERRKRYGDQTRNMGEQREADETRALRAIASAFGTRAAGAGH